MCTPNSYIDWCVRQRTPTSMRPRNKEWPQRFIEVDIQVSPLRLHSVWTAVASEWKNRLQHSLQWSMLLWSTFAYLTTLSDHVCWFVCLFVCLFSSRYNSFCLYFHMPVAGFDLLIRGFLITHNDAPQSVELLWTSDQSVAETSTWQQTTLTTDKLPCPRWDSNPRSQQASGRRPTP